MVYGFDIYTFVDLCSDDSELCEIYDYRDGGGTVFSGTLRDAQFCDFADYEILSIDLCSHGVHKDINSPVIIFNIETESEDEGE